MSLLNIIKLSQTVWWGTKQLDIHVNHLKCQVLFSLKNNKSNFIMSYAANLLSILMVNHTGEQFTVSSGMQDFLTDMHKI